MKSSRETRPVPDPGETKVKQGRQQKLAAGFEALCESATFGIGQAGAENSLRTFWQPNQVHSFICQSCAWPNPDEDRSFAEFCENGFKAVSFEVDPKRLTSEFFREHSIEALSGKTEHWLGQQGRLTEPLVRREGATHYEPVEGDEAFRMIADELNALESPDEAIFYTSGRTSKETAFLCQLFVRLYTQDFDKLVAQLRAAPWEDIVASSGLSRERIREAARVAMEAKSIVVCWCMGLTQHKNSVATIQKILNSLFLRGNIGRPGTGPCPVRGHSNVQGDRSIGIWDKPKEEFLDRLGRQFDFEPPREHGFDMVNSIKAMTRWASSIRPTA